MAVSSRPKGLALLAVALRTRTSASMLVFGLSSGLPFSLLIGTLTAWLGEAKVNLATVGVLAFAGLAYAFKFLWSPLVDRVAVPLVGRLGRRKGWIVACQLVLVASLLALAATDPVTQIGRFALLAVLGALASATQDVAIDGWRIDVADEATPVELLSALYQLGYRTAAIIGGAFALFLAARMSWPAVYVLMAGIMALLLLVALIAPERRVTADRAATIDAGELAPALRLAALGVVGACWLGAMVAIGRFMAGMLAPVPAGGKPPSAADFLRYEGPWIVVATVVVPLAIAAITNRVRRRSAAIRSPIEAPRRSGTALAADHLYGALVSPLAELTGRLGWGVLVVIGLILTYALCYNVWASFAYPFYLDYLHYSKDEVAFASKLFGIVMSIIGVALGGYLFLRLGRFPTLLLGAAMPIFGNFLYADLAEGGAHIDAVAHLLRLDILAGGFGQDARMTRLLMTICYENIATGLAGAAFTAFVSGIVAKRFAAVQYALLSSLTFLIGSLGKSVAGEAIDAHGYATVFRWVAVAGLPAIGFVLVEWLRASRTRTTAEPGRTGEPA
ncbi:MAG: AmpG family muropeptide MFS transporter [Janthinobacterium lividum]